MWREAPSARVASLRGPCQGIGVEQIARAALAAYGMNRCFVVLVACQAAHHVPALLFHQPSSQHSGCSSNEYLKRHLPQKNLSPRFGWRSTVASRMVCQNFVFPLGLLRACKLLKSYPIRSDGGSCTTTS